MIYYLSYLHYLPQCSYFAILRRMGMLIIISHNTSISPHFFAVSPITPFLYAPYLPYRLVLSALLDNSDPPPPFTRRRRSASRRLFRLAAWNTLRNSRRIDTLCDA